ncbi:MAG: ester cyclase [Candidatus Aminicenantales bacterium]
MKRNSCVVCLAVVFLLMAFTQGYAQEPKLDLKKVADKIIETMKSSDPVAVANLYAPDAVMIQADLATPLRGREALLGYYKAMYKAMPDFKSDLSVVAFSADTIVFEAVGEGTFTAPLATPEGEVPPTGKKIIFKAAFLAKISPDGLIAEDRTYFDNLAFMKQLGVIK